MVIVLGAIVVMVPLSLWCDLTDSWSNVFGRNTSTPLRAVVRQSPKSASVF
jgi:hypothetical protein